MATKVLTKSTFVATRSYKDELTGKERTEDVLRYEQPHANMPAKADYSMSQEKPIYISLLYCNFPQAIALCYGLIELLRREGVLINRSNFTGDSLDDLLPPGYSPVDDVLYQLDMHETFVEEIKRDIANLKQIEQNSHPAGIISEEAKERVMLDSLPEGEPKK